MDFITRKEWGAAPPKSRETVDWKARRGVAYHHSTGANLGRDDCKEWVKAIQEYHQKTQGWADIGYNWLVCRHGDIFEGRGWTALGAHVAGHNTPWVGVCYLGDAREARQITDKGRAAMVALGEEADRRAKRKLGRTTHGDLAATACPGRIRAWVAQGMPLSAGSGGDDQDTPSTPAGGIVLARKPLISPRSTRPAAGSDLEMETRRVQAELNGVHGISVAVDGWPGPKTAEAVRVFQRRAQLDPDGIVGPLTWPRLLA